MSRLQSVSPSQPHAAVENATDDPLLRFAGSVGGSHALVIAPNGLNLMCSLIRQGCAAATTMRLAERPDVKTYDLVLVPKVTSAMPIGQLVHQAKRALVPTGRLLALVPTVDCDPVHDVVGLFVRSLRLAGFVSIRRHMVSDGMLVRAEAAMPDWVIRRQA